MKLNANCLRDTLLYIEANQEILSTGRPDRIKPKNFNDEFLEKYVEGEVFYHVKQLADSKLISVERESGCSPRNYTITDITPKGHKFIEQVREDTMWNKVLEIASKVGNKSIDSLMTIAENVTSQLIINTIKSLIH